MEIDLTPLILAQEQALELVEDADKREFAERFLRASAIHLERAARGLLSEIVDEINDAAQGELEARLVQRGGALHLEVARRAEERADEELARVRLERGGEIEKLTLRLPPDLKKAISDAAALGALSLNTWIINHLSRAVGGAARASEGEGPWVGRSLRGFVGWEPTDEA
ncbi:MAG: toxin-antitoxin system HicB family antitoxin [Chloroflexota bacterium]|nr:toxin-antitoxin system HicB family antitoxin [Chloroflexota bacterium]